MAEVTIENLLKGIIEYNKETGAFDQKRIFNFSSSPSLNNVPCIIPNATYHPEVRVVVDFMSKFTVDFETDTGLFKGQRLVPTDVLLDRATTIANFWAYYFNDAAFTDISLERTLSNIADTDVREEIKGNQKYYSSIVQSVLKSLKQNNEETATQFINQIINMFITDIQIERNVKDIGSCTVTLRDNFTFISEAEAGARETLFFRSMANILNQLFTPMLPISVWAKGRLYPKYWFPIFTGYIFQTNPTDKEGFTSFTVVCKDALELTRISTEMVNPALVVLQQVKKQDTIQLYSQPFYNKSMWEIAKLMFNGGRIDGVQNSATGQTDKRSRKDDQTKARTSSIKFAQIGTFNVLNQNSKIFYKNYFNDPIDYSEHINVGTFLRKLRTPKNVLLWGEDVTPYKMWSFASPKTFTSEFTSRYEILKLAAQRGYLDFYADALGNIRIHPMRLTNQFFENDAIYSTAIASNIRLVKRFPSAFIVSPHETVNSNKLFDIQNMVSFMRIGGSPAELGTVNEDTAALTNTLGSAVDKVLMERFGFRFSEIIDDTLNFNPTVKGTKGTYRFFDLAARELLKYKNGELYTRTANIIFRPELELANPVYFTDTKEVFYIQSITHSISIGATATTTINGNFGRTENELPPMLFDFIVANQKMHVFGTDKEVSRDTNLTTYFEQELDRYVFPTNEADLLWNNSANKWKGIKR